MSTLSKRLGISMVAALVMASITTGAHGQVIGGGRSPFGGEARGMTRFAGKVVCVGCTVEEVQKAHPDQHDLYLLRHRRGQVVMEVDAVDERPLWSYFAWPPRIWVRASDELLAKLITEQNLFKTIEITGFLGSTRTLDVTSVTVTG